MQPKRDQDFFWEGVDNGALLVQQCANCGAKRHPPMPGCPECLSMDWTACELSGLGTVYSWLISKHPGDPDAKGRIVLLVDMDDGIRIVANFEEGRDVAVGDRVKAGFGDINGMTLPVFSPAD